MITVDNLDLTINKHKILKNINCVFEKNKVTALLGHNGCGKSMLLRSICNYHSTYQGHVSIFDKDLKKYSDRERAYTISYLPQEFPQIDNLTVKELVLYGRYPIRGAYASYTQEDHEKVEESIRLSGLSDLTNRLLSQLSGGEKQRAWIAMILSTDSKILLLDEPISALDIRYQIEIIKLIKKINTQKGKTIVWVLHNLDYAINYSDNIIALKQGEIKFRGSFKEFANIDTLQEIFDTRFEIFKKNNVFYVRAIV